MSDAETTCADRVKTFATQGIGRRADIDINTYRLLTLNAEGTLAFINPFVGLNNAKLESIIELGGLPRAWLPLPDRMEAWVILENDRLLAIDLHERRISRAIELPADSQANWLAIDATSNALWIGFKSSPVLRRLDLLNTSSKTMTVDASPLVELVAADVRSRTEVTGADVSPPIPIPGVISVHMNGDVVWRNDIAAASWNIGAVPVAAAYSSLARRVIAARADGTIVWLDPAAHGVTIERKLSLGHDVRKLALFDNERFAMAVGDGKSSVIDLASGQTTMTLRAPLGADQIVFSAAFAYAVDSKARTAVMWSLADLRAGRDTSADVLLGQSAQSDDFPDTGFKVAVTSPDKRGLLASGGRDGMLYQFAEGMMAPIGSYSNYRRAALSLAVLDLSLKETSPGRYVSSFRHRRGGRYELLVSGIGPSFNMCSTMELPPVQLTGDPLEERVVARLVAVTSGRLPGSASQIIEVRLQRRSDDSQVTALTDVPDLSILVFDRLSGWQQRARMREGEKGIYLAEVTVPRRAQYELHATSVSRNISLAEGRIGSTILGDTK